MRLRAPVAVVAGGALALLTACGIERNAGQLEDSAWRLVSIASQGTGVPANASPTLIIRNGQASGFGGCNGYSMVVTVYGTVTTFGAVTTAPQPCAIEGSRLELEYFRALAGVARADRRPDALILRDQDGKERARFVPLEAVAG